MTAPARNGRRWFRFSLRSLFVVVTVFAIWLAWCVNSARRQREAIAAIRALDPQAEFYYSFQALATGEEFDYDPAVESPLPAPLISTLGKDFFYRVHAVYLSEGKQETVASLAGLPGLKCVAVAEPVIAAVEQLNTLPRLKELYLILSPDPEPPSGGGFPILRWLFGMPPPEPPPPKPPRQNAEFRDVPPLPSLKRLFLGGESADSTLTDLERFPQVESFQSFWDELTDDGLRRLTGLPRLKKLKIDGPGVTDEGIQYLLQIKNLESLSLGSSKVTAAGLLRLKALPKLRELAIPSGLSAEAPTLGKELPNCTITVN